MLNRKCTSFFALLSALLIFGSILTGCKNDEDNDPPAIHLVNPVIHQHYTNGGTIPWTGTVTDKSTITHVALAMWNEDDSTHLLFNVDYYPDAPSFDLDTFYVVDDTKITEYHFRITAEDQAGNTARNPAEDHVHINE